MSMRGPTFGERLEELRVERGMSVEQLAEKVGMGTERIYRYQYARNVSAVVLKRFCKALGCSLGEFDDCFAAGVR